VIAEFKFGYDADYQNGTQLLAKVLILTDDGDVRDKDGTPGQTTVLYSCGKGWEADGPKGEHAVLEDPTKKKQFKSSSKMGLLQNAALDSGARDVMRERGMPWDAATWVGLNFHWQRKSHDYGGEIGKKDTLLPSKFLGVEGGKGAGAKSSSGGSSSGTKVKAGGESAKLGARARAQLLTFAADFTDREEFVAAALERDDVKGNDAAEEAVMASGDGSIWAESRS
jgi:hypothetical protein